MPVRKVESVPSSSAKNNRKPTMLQYLKALDSDKFKEHHLVTKVWFPGRFSNITLETELFRSLVYPHQEEYDVILEFLAEYFLNDDYLIYISIEGIEEGDWSFSSDVDNVVHWRFHESLGMYEMKEVTARKTSKRGTRKKDQEVIPSEKE